MINTIIYLLMAVMCLCLIQNKAYGQEAGKTSPEAMKQKIATNLSVSEKRAEEIQQALDFNKKEIGQLLLAKKLHVPAEMAKLRKLVSDVQVHITKSLTVEERAKLSTIVSPEIQQRKAVSIQKIQAARQQPGQSSTKKTNP